MPIEEVSDYPEKMTEFELHWGSVNAFLGGESQSGPHAEITLPAPPPN